MSIKPKLPAIISTLFRVRHPSLSTTVAGITFENPVGLAAGFDHEAQLPGIIGTLGFGFESIGTVTHHAYAGNPYPRLKRLVKSRSILVNKGFKSSGIASVLTRLEKTRAYAPWSVPIGISIGRTNTLEHKSHADAIADIVSAFSHTIKVALPFAYYELNISCPNLQKDISFYDAHHFTELLRAIEALVLDKPLFIKMPIGLSEEKSLALLDVCLTHAVAGVIFGNLQHDRTHHTFDTEEIATYAQYKGNWSGLPCQEQSDHLVRLAYQHTRGKLAIVGCGGVFTATDAYRKIRNGASLIQLVTATIFEGPQVAAEICADLPQLLARDGFSSITEAVGVDA